MPDGARLDVCLFRARWWHPVALAGPVWAQGVGSGFLLGALERVLVETESQLGVDPALR